MAALLDPSVSVEFVILLKLEITRYSNLRNHGARVGMEAVDQKM